MQGEVWTVGENVVRCGVTVEVVGELWAACLVTLHASIVQSLLKEMSFPSLTSTQPIGTSGLSNASFAYCMASFINA